MDLNKWLNIIKSIPKDKLKTDEGLKQVFRELGQKGGKKFTEQELNNYVAQFRKMSKTENMGSLLNKLTKKGVDPKDINDIKKRFK